MSKGFLTGFGAMLAVLSLIVYLIHLNQRGNYLEPQGQITGIRQAPIDDANSVLILDFSMTNPSDRDMVVRTVSVTAELANGAQDGDAIASSDVPRLYRAHPELGAVRNEPVKARERVAPHQTASRSAVVRFSVPASDLASRRSVKLVIEDVTGPKLELTAK